MNSQSTTDFYSFSFHPLIDRGIQAAGFSNPTPIQAQAIPLVLEGHDIMGLAQTGTGKTAAFVLPILNRLMADQRRCTRALILAPTRELAEQINDVIKQLAHNTKLRSMTVYGGVSIVPQFRKLREGVEIVVACPGRLLDHIHQGSINLKSLEILVLDEADQMFDMGFLPNLREIVKALPTKRQTLMFSATMPDEIQSLAQQILTNPKTVHIANTQPVSTVSHAVFLIDRDKKNTLLHKLLEEAKGSTSLIFTRTKYQAMRLSDQLNRDGYSTISLQGSLSQAKRRQALEGFKRGRYQVLVATDIAARGIDIAQIGFVINYDIPDTAQAYTHRIGRTGRACTTGCAYTFVTTADLYLLRIIERTIGKKIERQTREGITTASWPTHATPSSDKPRRASTHSHPSNKARHQQRHYGKTQRTKFNNNGSRTHTQKGSAV